MATSEGVSTFQSLLYVADQPVENIADTFKGLVPEQKRFEAACTLMAMLEDGDLQANQRIVALYILYHLYNVVPIHENPFLLLFLNLYKSLFSNLAFVKANYDLLVEFRVEALILADKGAQLANKTPTDIFFQFSNTENSLMDTEEVNIAKFEYYIKNEFDVRPKGQLERQPETKKSRSWVEIGDKEVREISYTPPPQVQAMQHEPHSLELDSVVEVDYNTLAANLDRDEVRSLMNRALQGALSIPEEEFILKQLEKNDKLIYTCDFSPEKLPFLIENNSRVAIKVLLQLKSSPQIDQYLETLLTIDDPERSQQSSMEPVNRMRSSMEVVNNLLLSFPLTPEFLHSYLSNCVRACEGCQNRGIQERQVRLICVFLQSLIHKNIIDVSRFFIEIQAFCLQFSRNREAASLFRFLLDYQKEAVSEEVATLSEILNSSDINGENGDHSGKCELS
ncbi:CCR4-NOT transcription complex subunit 11 [Gigaspora margarita]|uniref:CCR4-NOT transcription complex subunit 11 n=1 Tax=Gigaspora margarita TaxID=4874 RepID=A0A8H3X6Y5_GIGMA|nr:CCR4-NOT transcription complex subunit 11 [Gigaspora margarita]